MRNGSAGRARLMRSPPLFGLPIAVRAHVCAARTTTLMRADFAITAVIALIADTGIYLDCRYRACTCVLPAPRR